MLMMEIIIKQLENQTINIENNNIQEINIDESTAQEININKLNPQDLNIKQKENQIIYIEGNGTATGINDVLVNGVSVVSDGIAYVITPTKTSELINDSGYITHEVDPTVASYIKAISQADINNWNNKQDELVSGNNIKTINNTSLLGNGNINIDGTIYTAGTGININSSNVISNTIVSYNDLQDLPEIPTATSELQNDSDFVSSNELADVAFSGSYIDLSNTPEIPDSTSELINDSGYINKNVNDLTYYTPTTNLGSVALSNNYNDLNNKPTIPTKTSDLTNDSGYLVNSDSGWIDLTLLNGVTARDNNMTYKPQIRKINNVVYMKGQVNIPTTNSDIIMCNIPDGYRPSFEAKMSNVITNNWIDTSGNIYLSATNQLYFQSINTFWLVN